jgi:hypothetical protein
VCSSDLVRKSYGEGLPQGSEVAIAVVDEGLLELMPNKSWKLLDAMMGRRGYEVQTATAQMQVVGKRHYGLKALPQGGGGGKQITRELFDTLLFWKARVLLDEKGEAAVEIPLGDSLTSFRIAAIASDDDGLFGTGEMSISTSQDLMVLPGIPPLIREGDVFKAGFTVRNASNRKMDVEVRARLNSNLKEEKELNVIHQSLPAGEAGEVGWDIKAPAGIDSLTYEVSAKEQNGEAYDTIRVNQKVAEVLPVRTFQATSTQVGKSFSLDVGKPADAPLEKGGINVSLRPRLSNGLGGVSWYMKRYPYTCMEQKVSRAIALRDESLWRNIAAELPSYLDTDGLVKYFPALSFGSDMLTSYVLSISNEAGWEIPKYIKQKMETGLKGFIESRVIRYSSLPTADLSIRKMAAVEALSRSGNTDLKLLGSISIEPDLWPTSAVIDWMNVLMRMKNIPDRERKLKEAEQMLRARINFQGTTMNFSTEKTDHLWWLMVSGDLNAVKGILCLSHFDSWNEDMPKLVKGAIARQYRGAWDTTLANAWGVLAMEKFSEKFEKVAVTGVTKTSEKDIVRDIDWSQTPDGGGVMFPWSEGQEKVIISHQGTGSPWATIQSLAAILLKGPFSSGYTMKKTIIPVEQKTEGKWSRGDVARVKLELEAQADMTWVVVSDPVPAGAAILGTGLGRDSKLLAKDETREGWVWPVFEERSFEAFRAYYEFVPKGKWTIEYTVRLNNEGIFNLPPTRVEALYAPGMMGESPNEPMVINP